MKNSRSLSIELPSYVLQLLIWHCTAVSSWNFSIIIVIRYNSKWKCFLCINCVYYLVLYNFSVLKRTNGITNHLLLTVALYKSIFVFKLFQMYTNNCIRTKHLCHWIPYVRLMCISELWILKLFVYFSSNYYFYIFVITCIFILIIFREIFFRIKILTILLFDYAKMSSVLS